RARTVRDRLRLRAGVAGAAGRDAGARGALLRRQPARRRGRAGGATRLRRLRDRRRRAGARSVRLLRPDAARARRHAGAVARVAAAAPAGGRRRHRLERRAFRGAADGGCARRARRSVAVRAALKTSDGPSVARVRFARLALVLALVCGGTGAGAASLPRQVSGTVTHVGDGDSLWVRPRDG